jgi:succinyl-CoA synthetase alpha subunit
VASRSGTLTYEIAASLTHAGIGQSTCIGIGGDPFTGLDFVDALKMFRDDESTDAVVLIGEIGGSAEENAANYIKETNYPKPVAAYVAGRAAPPGKRMGHAGAIITGTEGTADAKIQRFREVGVRVADIPSELPRLLGAEKALTLQQ